MDVVSIYFFGALGLFFLKKIKHAMLRLHDPFTYKWVGLSHLETDSSSFFHLMSTWGTVEAHAVELSQLIHL